MDYNSYREKWELAKTGVTPNIPLNIDLELTSHCNLRCDFCPHSNDFKDKGDMDIQLAKKLILQASDMGTPAIKFNLRGEPTLYEQLPELIGLAVDNGIIDTRINTNGQCRENVLIDCMKSGLHKMIFSLDADTSDTYNKIRGGDFNRVVWNINKLCELGYSDRLLVQFTKSDVNAAEVDGFLKRWDGLATRVSKCTDRGAKIGDALKGNRKYCGQPSQRMAVLYDGTVINCCSDWNRSYVIGNANEQTLFAIWHSERANKIRRDLLDLKHDEYPHCKKCFCTESYVL
jgi:radical SAM protein with 4Fe4S-binding SPASM domain